MPQILDWIESLHPSRQEKKKVKFMCSGGSGGLGGSGGTACSGGSGGLGGSGGSAGSGGLGGSGDSGGSGGLIENYDFNLT